MTEPDLSDRPADSGPPELRDVETDWRRLNPRMLLIHPVQEAIRFLPALAGVFILGRNTDRGGGPWELAAVVVVIGIGLLRYVTTRFRIENGQIELRKGLFTKQVIATPADRVRTVDLTSPILHRFLGLAKVEIGTAGTGRERLVLDSLTLGEARHLREELIHRRNVVHGADPASGGSLGANLPAPQGDPVPGLAPPPPSAVGDPGTVWSRPETPGTETVLVTFDPAWVRFAPLTMTGVFSALAILGFGNQFLQRYLEQADLGSTVDTLGRHALWIDVVVGLVGVVVLVSLLAIIGYALQFWGFRLTRHEGGTLHVTRGLTTTRETSIEEKRLRGLEVGQPLGLRLANGGRLHAITTGLTRKEQEHGSAWLVPSAPRDVVDRVAAAVLGDDEALHAELTPHGPAARRRRFTRAITPAALLAAAAWVLALSRDWPVWLAVVLTVPLLLAPFVAIDRYAGLGHHLTARHLVVRQGTFVRRRDILQRDGIIGWNIEQSFFQRRVGLAHVVATTAAGKQRYLAYDVPLEVGLALAAEVDPALFAQFAAPL
ncbi:MAG: PH domain-containing protein [Lapillicoccus sp.]